MKKKVLALSLSFLLLVSIFATVFAGTASAAGDSFNNAQTISTNTWYQDNLQYWEYDGFGGFEESYFTFTLPKDGVISLSHYHAKVPDYYFYDNEYCPWNVHLYNGDFQEMFQTRISGGKPNTQTTGKIGLPKGKYYIKVSGDSGDSYKIKVNYSVSNAWEKEWNDSLNSANLIVPNKTYSGTGLIGEYDADEDNYKISIPANGYMSITFGHKVAYEYNSWNPDAGWTVTCYNSNWQEIKEWNFSNQKPLSESTSKFKVSKGTYYFKVHDIYDESDTYTIRANYYFTLAKPNISKITITPTVARVYWNRISGASGYLIYRSTSKNGTYKRVKTISGNSTAVWKNTGLTPNKTYYYKVRAYKTIGGKNYYSGFSAVRGKKLSIYKARIASAKNLSGKKMLVKWKKTRHASGYQLRYYYTASSKKNIKIKGISSLSKTVKSLKKGKTYKVYVRAYKVFKGKTYYGPWSVVKKVKITK